MKAVCISPTRFAILYPMKILIIDDDRALGRSLQLHLEREGHTIATAATGNEGLAAFAANPFDLAFVDLKLPDLSGLEILARIRAARPETLAVMITGTQDTKATIEAVRLGAFDYIRKPLDLDAVLVTVEKAAQSLKRPASARVALDSETAGRPHEIVGGDPKIIDMLKQVGLLSQSRIPVLIEGETGTGKELVARALHEATCPGKPFVALNCSAVVATLLESELFGHARGAFTGADTEKVGRLELAADGTIFFDEIGDMAFDLQAKLLRTLQEREFERVGSVKPIPLRARVMAATHRDLEAMVKEGKFREDLFYRLAVSTVRVPPLRERRGDIPQLVNHILARLGPELHKDIQGLEEAALRRLQAYDWPGNVRELENVLTRAAVLERGPALREDTVATAMGRGLNRAARPDEIKTLRDAEKDHVETALYATGWNITQTATLLDISPTTLRKKIADYSLTPPPGTR
ncbi:MAG: sigma-54 dependent transcriptional regulator [FCB group bacterium]|nr:sigma-54 dependent transcriptional regulator [FCB group bacterium]